MGTARVEIVIQGTLSETLIAVISDFHVDRVEHGQTHLVGPEPDQTRLQAILALFSSLNIRLVSVNPLPSLT